MRYNSRRAAAIYGSGTDCPRVPRNKLIVANADTAYFDLGSCGPTRTDFVDHKHYCGRFKTPAFRNVPRRRAFFHNVAFTTLEEGSRFYAQRDVQPGKFYGTDQHGGVRKYEDLPARYWSNVNVNAPFGRRTGQRPAFSEAGALDIIAFLRTLNDGFAASTGGGRR